MISTILTVIAIHDFITKRIPNLFLVTLLVCLKLQGARVHSLLVLLVSAPLILLFTRISKCGFGDTKLALIVLNFLIPAVGILQYLEFVTFISALLVLVHFLRFRSLRGNIAFGPALCGAVLPFLS